MWGGSSSRGGCVRPWDLDGDLESVGERRGGGEGVWIVVEEAREDDKRWVGLIKVTGTG